MGQSEDSSWGEWLDAGQALFSSRNIVVRYSPLLAFHSDGHLGPPSMSLVQDSVTGQGRQVAQESYQLRDHLWALQSEVW